MNQLQKSLRLNAIFSGISGLAILILNKQLADLFETANTTVFVIIGIALVFFAGTIIYEINKQRSLAILWIIIQDFFWVTGSIILVSINPFEISTTGNIIIAIVALVVLIMGLNQLNALAQIDSDSNNKNKHLKFGRIIKADKQSVWKAIADVANYDKVAPNIDAVKIISGEGRGMVRSCSHGKDSWTETCSMWIEEEAYSFEVNTSDPDYPYPFIFLKGTWEVQEIDSTITKVSMLFDFQYKHSYQNWLLHPLLRGKFSKTANELLDNWQSKLELPAQDIIAQR